MKHHSLPYNILYDIPWGLHSNEKFYQNFQVGNPKNEIFVVLKFWTFISSSNQTFLEHARALSHSLRRNLFNSVSHAPIGDHLSFTLKRFVVPPFFYHNSCISFLKHFRHLHFKTFPMLSYESNLVFFCHYNQGSEHLGRTAELAAKPRPLTLTATSWDNVGKIWFSRTIIWTFSSRYSKISNCLFLQVIFLRTSHNTCMMSVPIKLIFCLQNERMNHESVLYNYGRSLA